MRYHAAIRMYLIVCVLLTLSGCSRPIVQADNPSAIPERAYEPTFSTAIEVLRDNGFTIDRRDYRFGEITTMPLGSPNLFEVWNSQNTTNEQAVESTLASEQRRVKVRFTRLDTAAEPGSAEGGGRYAIELEVMLERLQVPTRRLAGSARRNVFSNLAAPPRDLIDKGVTGNYWEAVGRDPLLEARLIRQITERAVSNP